MHQLTHNQEIFAIRCERNVRRPSIFIELSSPLGKPSSEPSSSWSSFLQHSSGHKICFYFKAKVVSKCVTSSATSLTQSEWQTNAHLGFALISRTNLRLTQSGWQTNAQDHHLSLHLSYSIWVTNERTPAFCFDFKNKWAHYSIYVTNERTTIE